MSTHIQGSDVGHAWLEAFSALLAAPGSGLVNLTVTVENPLREDLGVRRALEGAIANLRDQGTQGYSRPQSMHTVANTLFPISLYRPGKVERFFANALQGQIGRGGKPTSWQPSGTYIGRLIRYPMADAGGTVNQLDLILNRLKTTNLKDYYEVGIENPGSPVAACADSSDAAAIFLPGFDNQRRGGQCLSHISLTLLDNRLSLTALYRHQVYVTRAYGNFLGLARILAFLAHESDHEVGELMIVATHADIDAPRNAARDLARRAKELLGQEPSDVELSSRPLGSTWRDLELPKRSSV